MIKALTTSPLVWSGEPTAADSSTAGCSCGRYDQPVSTTITRPGSADGGMKSVTNLECGFDFKGSDSIGGSERKVYRRG